MFLYLNILICCGGLSLEVLLPSLQGQQSCLLLPRCHKFRTAHIGMYGQDKDLLWDSLRGGSLA